MEIISSMIIYNLDILVTSIESLVGVVNFDFEEMHENGKGKRKEGVEVTCQEIPGRRSGWKSM